MLADCAGQRWRPRTRGMRTGVSWGLGRPWRRLCRSWKVDPAHRPQNDTGIGMGRESGRGRAVSGEIPLIQTCLRGAPSLMSRLYSSSCHVRVRELLGHLDHSDIRKVVIPCIRNKLASAGGFGRSDHWAPPTTALNHLGSYDEAHWVTD